MRISPSGSMTPLNSSGCASWQLRAESALEEKEVGVAHHQVDVFLLNAAGKYLGRLCRFNQCPKHKPECRANGCGKVPFLRQHDEFVDQELLRPEHIQVLYDRNQPETALVPANVP